MTETMVERVAKCFAMFPDRFLDKIQFEPNSGCWLWMGAPNHNGYGYFKDNGLNVRAHRYSYIKAHGPIPDGLQIDHLCRVRSCVNPDHLEAVTTLENTRRGQGGEVARARQKAKTHCPKSHPYDDKNTYVAPNGHRHCRACQAARQRRRYYRKRKSLSSLKGGHHD